MCINGNAMTILGNKLAYNTVHRLHCSTWHYNGTMLSVYMSLLSVYGPSYQSIGPSYQSIGPSYQSTGRSIVLQLRSPKLQFNTNQGDFYNATMIT